jgi:Nif-specific regulatory protein
MNHPFLAPFRVDDALATTALELLASALQSSDALGFAGKVLPCLLAAAGGDYAALLTGAEGQWAVLVATGSPQAPPVELLAEVLDREQPAMQGHWVASPLETRQAVSEVLAVHLRSSTLAQASTAILRQLGPVLAAGLAAVRRQQADRQRIGRLEATVAAARQFARTSEVQPLLVAIAQAATRLLEADRASIFLWDRPNRLLVARPALGVKEGELVVPDDRGVVGQVIQTGRPRRVDSTREPNEIDHHVDQQLGYRTRTLLCVPLRGASGELFGAFELINKRVGVFTADDEAALVELAELAGAALENAQDRQQLLNANRRIAQQAADRVQMVGNSPAITALRSVIQRVAQTDLAVLVLGENGTGKEVVAQSIHYRSPRREKPFVAVNCAAIPDSLAESELFGHEKGAFTDARQARCGKFELATGGTLLLDEIGELSPASQARLLRVLEEKVLVRVGGSQPVHVDVRIIAATNQDLAEMVRERRFREDLFFRLNVVALNLPPLRDRREDILPLATYFLGEFCARARRPVPEFSPAAEQQLQSHAWPGNVRELRNAMERLAYLSSANPVELEDLAFMLSVQSKPAQSPPRLPLASATDQFQVDYINGAIRTAGGNMSEAAARLGLHRSNLYRKMRQLGMPTS